MCTGTGGFIPRSFSLKICNSTDSYVKDLLKSHRSSALFPFKPLSPSLKFHRLNPSIDPSRHTFESQSISTNHFSYEQPSTNQRSAFPWRWSRRRNDGGGSTWCLAVTNSCHRCSRTRRGHPFQPTYAANTTPAIHLTPIGDSRTDTGPPAVIGAN